MITGEIEGSLHALDPQIWHAEQIRFHLTLVSATSVAPGFGCREARLHFDTYISS